MRSLFILQYCSYFVPTADAVIEVDFNIINNQTTLDYVY